MFAPGSGDGIVTAPTHNLIGAENPLQSKYLLGVTDVRVGSKADLKPQLFDVSFNLNSGH
jgi:hypothetical protein